MHRYAGFLFALLAVVALAPAASAQCIDGNAGDVQLQGTIKMVKFQPDDGGKPEECRVLILDQQTCIRSGILGGKRLLRELQLLPGTASATLPSSGRFVVSGTFGASPCRDLALEVSAVSAFAVTPSNAPAGSKAGAPPPPPPPPPGARKSVRLGYGGPDKVITKMDTWDSPVRKALLGMGLTPTRVEYYRDGTYPVFFVKQDPANVPLLRLQQTDPEAADRKAKALLKANGDAPFELVTDGDRFRYDGNRSSFGRGFEVVFED
jgi:hypothetical protein